MISESELDDALWAWRREYGVGGLPRAWPGVSPSQRIADYHGRGPQITGFRPQVMLGTIGDDVEACMRDMLNLHPIGYFALRCEYIGRQDRPIEAKLSQMAGWGMRLDREGYEELVRSGRAILAVMMDDLRMRASAERNESAGTIRGLTAA
jgi:hypothetical protein